MKSKEEKLKERLRFALLASLTLGLAPFFPEPHLFGKIRWVAGGANGMEALDWFDLAWHSWPWVLLVVFGIQWIKSKAGTSVA
ncbi:MAG: hypothetical protein KDC12_07955 [Flavobacteriales bacterium]|nr:hypothetical protein [Flavobacteriales bacterium]